MRALRTTLLSLGTVLVAILVVIAALFGLAQTGFGRAYLAELAGRLASRDGLVVRIEGLTGFVPSNLRVARISLSDPKGPFADVSGLHLKWRPAALLSGTVSVETLEAAQVNVARRPELPPAPASPDTRSSLPGVRIIVDRFAAPDIALGAPVVGSAARFSFEAGLRLMEPERGLSTSFDLERLDAPGSVKGNVSYIPQSGVLDLDLVAQEPPGGVVARLAGLEGLPALDAQLKGAGPLQDWSGTLAAAAGDQVRLDGTARIVKDAAAHVLTLSAGGEIARLLPADLAPVFEGRSQVNGEMRIAPDLAVDIRRFVLTAAAGTAELSGTIDATRRSDLRFAANIGDARRLSGLLPPAAGLGSAQLSGTLTGPPELPAFTARLEAAQVRGYGYGAQALGITAQGTPNAARRLAVTADIRASGLSAQDPNVAAALGRDGTAALEGEWAPGLAPVLTSAVIRLAGVDANFSGRASESVIDGALAVPRLDLAALAPLAARPLRGMLAFDAKVSRAGGQGALSLDLTGRAEKVETGEPTLDGLIAGDTRFAGGVSYGSDGAVDVRDLKVSAPGADLAVNGRIDANTANLSGTARLADLKRLDPRLEGSAEARAAFSGTLKALDVTGQVTVPQGAAMGRPLRGLTLDVTARDLTGRVNGTATLTGDVGGRPARGAGAFATAADGTRALSGLDLAVGRARLTGDLTAPPSGLLSGLLTLNAQDLADLAPLMLQEVAGRADARIELAVVDGVQQVGVRGTLGNLLAEGQRVADARFDFTVTDPRASAAIAGSVEARGVTSGSVTIEQMRLVATPAAGATSIALTANAQGAAITAGGRIIRADDAQTFRLEALRVARDRLVATLAGPATIVYRDGTATLDRLALNVGGGTLSAQGRFGDTLDLNLDARALPLALASLANPGLNLSGTLAASARIGGTPAAPTGRYEVTISRFTSPEVARAGVGPYDMRATGTLESGRAGVNATISGPSLSGVAITGSVPVAQGELDLTARGTISLAIANALLATSGARASGNAVLDVRVRGALDAPRAGGTIRITGGRYEDAPNGVTIDRIEAVLTGTDRSVTITSFRAATPNGGTITAQGNVALDPAAGFPGRIEATLTNANLVNSEMIRFVTDGRVTLTGAFATRPTIGGRIDVRALDVNLPDRLPGGSAANVNVRHVNLPRGVTPAAPRARGGGGARSAGGFILGLDLTVSAPNRVFVRGMGMEAELGGTLRLQGTSAEPVTLGGFEMFRGRLDILGRRLDFTRGRLTFNGSTDPELDFIAESTASDVTARIIIAGRASQPEVSFSSSPALPQDEVVARLLFGRPTGQLSAGQALQVAQAVATMSGAGQATLGNLRRSLGLDSLDVGVNAAGTGGQIGLGRRLNDNVSLGVRQGTTSGSTQATIDIDLGRNIRLQGATGADGGTSVGIGAQWDY